MGSHSLVLHTVTMYYPVILGFLSLVSASPEKFSRLRGGRQSVSSPDNLYGAPEEVAQASELDSSYLSPVASESLDSYGAGPEEEDLGVYGGLNTQASDVAGTEMGIKMLMTGVPGEDYPIYAEIPDTQFSCDGQVSGGYYADDTTECQVFHICGDSAAKYSFLCPNGTIFNQNYFICDWWFNVDCSQAAAIAAIKNEELAAAAAEAAEAAASDSESSYAAPPAEDESYLAPAEYDEPLSGYGGELESYGRK